MKRYVKTDYAGCPFITAGKVYEATDCDELGFIATLDSGFKDYCSWLHSSHLGGHDWTECTADGTPIGEGDLSPELEDTLDMFLQDQDSPEFDLAGEPMTESDEYWALRGAINSDLADIAKDETILTNNPGDHL